LTWITLHKRSHKLWLRMRKLNQQRIAAYASLS